MSLENTHVISVGNFSIVSCTEVSWWSIIEKGKVHLRVKGHLSLLMHVPLISPCSSCCLPRRGVLVLNHEKWGTNNLRWLVNSEVIGRGYWNIVQSRASSNPGARVLLIICPPGYYAAGCCTSCVFLLQPQKLLMVEGLWWQWCSSWDHGGFGDPIYIRVYQRLQFGKIRRKSENRDGKWGVGVKAVEKYLRVMLRSTQWWVEEGMGLRKQLGGLTCVTG